MWAFDIERTSFESQSPNHNSKEVVYQTGKVTYGEEEGQLVLTYGNNEAITFSIDKYGRLDELPNKMCSGEIEGNNSLNLYLRWGNGSSGMIHKLSGKKLNQQASL